ncbi:ParB/RepB/Spo0J family partition protein [Pseudomethylobacillus aquaticus]|uniref:ParB/RepB/Spo0J family partition protein n=1 Tax=Pseudomethylobacillus aquaticus TaxID=2676064 RepID=A0A3N0V212_9PROT|nr:ParB/RepB/Spo0J family partition protein [Pseudomethylobacillus aquaticus]ROH86846.1 ParB/RepB/Spo0J family partition protein [Pseudomethylobacillus aquaticus]
MVKPKGLGRGLDALLSGDMQSVSEQDTLRTLNVSELQPGKYQPRTHMDQASLESLAESIRSQGIMQPIIVRAVAGGRHEIIAGERRWRASQLAGLTEVPVLVREIADEAALAMALIENIQRENLNPLEEASGIKRLIDEFALTHEAAAQAVGRSRTAVTNLLRLLNLNPAVQELLMQGKLEMGHARALLTLEPARQIMLAEKIALERLSVREAERLANQPEASAPRPVVEPDRDVLRLQESASEQLGANVTIQHQARGAGKLVVDYKSLDQLQSILARIGIRAD